MTLKLDMSKAYDRVEWKFLFEVMRKMGFWENMDSHYLSMHQHSLLLYFGKYGEPKGNIHPTRGIRQGDLFSPYLFLLCSKGFNIMLQQVARENLIRGYSLCKNGPRITLLFFADDNLLFCLA